MKKNILILHTDEQHFCCLGCDGNSFIRTPNIDRLAEQGTVFTRHIAGNPVCMPSRASLMTGLYPPGHNVWTNGVALNRKEYIEANLEILGDHIVIEPPTIADVFAEAGYDTASFGKLHLTPNLAPASYGYPESWKNYAALEERRWRGPYYGFQHVELTKGHGEGPCQAGPYAMWLRERFPEVPGLLAESAKNRQFPVPALRALYPSAVPSEAHNTSWLAERCSEFLLTRPQSEKPFLAFVGFPDPHHPFTPSADIAKKFEGCEVHTPADPEGRGILGTPIEPLLGRNRIDDLTEEDRKIVLRYTYAMLYQVDQADRGRDGALSCPAPPSEPDVRFSRIRLSGQ